MPEQTSIQPETWTTFVERFRRIIIPDFPQNFGWSNENCDRLLEDLGRIITSGHASYLGNITYVPLAGNREVMVVDGQHRVATTSLLVATIRYILWEKGGDRGASLRILLGQLLYSDNRHRHLRIIQQRGVRITPDQEIFQTIVGEPEVVQKKLDQQVVQWKTNVWTAFCHLYRNLRVRTVDDFWNIYHAIQRSLFVIGIAANHPNGPLTQPLADRSHFSELAVIQNFLISGGDTRWHEIGEILGDPDDTATENLIKCYLEMQEKRFVSTAYPASLYRQFKNYFNRHTTQDRAARDKILDELIALAHLYRYVLHPEFFADNVEVPPTLRETFAYKLGLIKEAWSPRWLPILVTVFDKVWGKWALLERDLDLFLSYFVRRTFLKILSSNALSMGRKTIELVGKIMGEIQDVDDHYAYLMHTLSWERIGEEFLFQDDEDLITRLRQGSFFAERAHLLLLVYEGALRGQPLSPHDFSRYRVEHLTPLHPTATWRQAWERGVEAYLKECPPLSPEQHAALTDPSFTQNMLGNLILVDFSPLQEGWEWPQCCGEHSPHGRMKNIQILCQTFPCNQSWRLPQTVLRGSEMAEVIANFLHVKPQRGGMD